MTAKIKKHVKIKIYTYKKIKIICCQLTERLQSGFTKIPAQNAADGITQGDHGPDDHHSLFNHNSKLCTFLN